MATPVQVLVSNHACNRNSWTEPIIALPPLLVDVDMSQTLQEGARRVDVATTDSAECAVSQCVGADDEGTTGNACTRFLFVYGWISWLDVTEKWDAICVVSLSIHKFSPHAKHNRLFFRSGSGRSHALSNIIASMNTVVSMHALVGHKRRKHDGKPNGNTKPMPHVPA